MNNAPPLAWHPTARSSSAPRRAGFVFAGHEQRPTSQATLSVVDMMSAIRDVMAAGDGEVRFTFDSGRAGSVFIHEGHVAWVRTGRGHSGLLGLLRGPYPELPQALQEARKEGRPLAAALAEAGMPSSALRTICLEHNRRQLATLLGDDPTGIELIRGARTYSADVLFTLEELLATPKPTPSAPTLSDGCRAAQEAVDALLTVDGAQGAAVLTVSYDVSVLASGAYGGFDVEAVALANAEVLTTKRALMASMAGRGENDDVEDIVMTTHQQYHLIRPVGVGSNLCVTVVLARSATNLGQARHRLRQTALRLRQSAGRPLRHAPAGPVVES